MLSPPLTQGLTATRKMLHNICVRREIWRFPSLWMTYLSSSLSSHLLSNLNFFDFLVGFVRISARIGRWSDLHNLMYFTTEWGHFSYQSSFPTAMSMRHLTVLRHALFSTHDNIFPVNGNSSIPQWLSICLKVALSWFNPIDN